MSRTSVTNVVYILDHYIVTKRFNGEYITEQGMHGGIGPGHMVFANFQDFKGYQELLTQIVADVESGVV